MRYNIFKLWLSIIIFLSYGSVCNAQQNSSNKRAGSKPDSVHVMALGKVIFANTCKACHGNPAFPKATSLEVMVNMQPRAIFNTLDNGKMKEQAKAFSKEQREAVAQYISQKLLRVTVMPKEAYTKFTFSGGSKLYDCSGWGGNLKATNYRTSEQSGITRDNIGSLSLKWAFAYPDASDMRSKPAIMGKWLLAGNSASGDVYAIDRLTGKLGWHVTASNGIRSGIVVAKRGNTYTAYFADGATYVYALDVRNGKILWSTKAGVGDLAMNTGTVAVYGGKVFVPISSLEVLAAMDGNFNCCTTSGGVAALDSKTGKLLWYHRVIPGKATARNDKKNGKPFFGPSGAPVWSSPTVDVKRNLLYIGTGENYSLPATTSSDAIQAVNMSTGKLVWNFQATEGDAWNMACPVLVNCPGSNGRDLDFGMAPLLVSGKDGKQRLLAGQKAGVVYALDPQNGKLLWKTRIGKGGALGGVHWGMAADSENVYAANADNPVALNMDDSTLKGSPGIYALDIITGAVTWSAPTQQVQGVKKYLSINSAAPVITQGVVFAGANDGYLRAYDTKDGKVIWSYNTAQTFQTVNGVPGNGGSIDSASPVLADGMLYVNSGYSLFGQKAGNVLLAFSVKK
jgi:polyvinyl alcohol dehydrogenase (cytochrome)